MSEKEIYVRKILISIVLASVLAVVGFVLAGAMTMSDASSNTASNRIVTGEYHGDGPGKMMFTAVITNGKIQVDLKVESGEEGDSDVYGKYWAGTFDTSNTSDTFTVVSTADNKILAKSVFGSQDDTKSFTYNNGVLSFGFAMDLTGTKTTVHLSK